MSQAALEIRFQSQSSVCFRMAKIHVADLPPSNSALHIKEPRQALWNVCLNKIHQLESLRHFTKQTCNNYYFACAQVIIKCLSQLDYSVLSKNQIRHS